MTTVGLMVFRVVIASALLLDAIGFPVAALMTPVLGTPLTTTTPAQSL